MGKIGGNRSAIIQVMGAAQNEIGEDTGNYIDALPPITGWLDLLEGDSQYASYSVKIQESTHVFLCDYAELRYKPGEGTDIELTPENSRMVIDGRIYEVKLYDNPMEMNEHLEIFLKYVGG